LEFLLLLLDLKLQKHCQSHIVTKISFCVYNKKLTFNTSIAIKNIQMIFIIVSNKLISPSKAASCETLQKYTSLYILSTREGQLSAGNTEVVVWYVDTGDDIVVFEFIDDSWNMQKQLIIHCFFIFTTSSTCIVSIYVGHLYH
jgi:hypothetical protein